MSLEIYKLEYDKFITLCKEVAETIGYDFIEGSVHQQNRCVIGKDVDKIVFYQNYSSKNKIEISGIYPRDMKNGYTPHVAFSIKVSENKSAKQIAKDIERRFLPKHREILQNVLETIERYTKMYVTQEEAILEIANYIGEKPTQNDIDRGNLTKYLEGSKYVKVKILSDKKVQLDISNITIEQVKKIYNIIKD